MTIRIKILSAMIGLAVASTVFAIFVLAWISFNSGEQALTEQSRDKLTAITRIKATEVDKYFRDVVNQVVIYSDDIMIIDAMASLKSAFRGYKFNPAFRDKKQLANKKQVVAGLYQTFSDRYKGLNPLQSTDYAAANEKLSETALNLQYYYISQNQSENSADMEKAADDSRYTKSHVYFHNHVREFMNRFQFENVYFVDNDSGNVVYSVAKNLAFATSLEDGPFADSPLASVYKKAREIGRDEYAIEDFQAFAPNMGEPAIFIASPIFEAKSFIGVLIFQIGQAPLNAIMTQSRRWNENGMGQTGESFLFAADKLYRSQSRALIEMADKYLDEVDTSRFTKSQLSYLKNHRTAVLSQPVVNQEILSSLKGETGSTRYSNYLGRQTLAAFAPVKASGLNWGLVTEISESEALAAIDALGSKIARWSIMVVIIAAVIAIVSALYIALNLSRPIQLLRELVTQVNTESNLLPRMSIAQRDEVGEMSRALNNLLERMQQSFTETLDISTRVTGFSEELKQNAGQSHSIVQQQLQEKERSTELMHSLLESVQQGRESTQGAMAISKQASVDATEGSNEIREVIQSVSDLESGIGSAAAVINDLAVHTQEITNIVGAIQGIAEQTNLLALNAAIEAARAGEQGRGFAVVADEVRSLAVRTHESTQEIHGMIERLQSGASSAVDVMHSEKEKIATSVKMANDAEQYLGRIIGAMNSIDQATSTVEQAINQQTTFVEQLNDSMSHTEVLVDQASEQAQKTAQSSEQLVGAAQSLHETVRQWKVS